MPPLGAVNSLLWLGSDGVGVDLCGGGGHLSSRTMTDGTDES